MFVLRERLKPASELKSMSCGNTFQIRNTLYTMKLKRVDEWHVSVIEIERYYHRWIQRNVLCGTRRVKWIAGAHFFGFLVPPFAADDSWWVETVEKHSFGVHTLSFDIIMIVQIPGAYTLEMCCCNARLLAYSTWYCLASRSLYTVQMSRFHDSRQCKQFATRVSHSIKMH